MQGFHESLQNWAFAEILVTLYKASHGVSVDHAVNEVADSHLEISRAQSCNRWYERDASISYHF